MFEKLPNDFKEKLKKLYSQEELEIIKSGFTTLKRQVSFRVNTLKSNNLEIE
jgi:16S rRNA C967 or C1407 C5-methylase (RsmB/RsmF family)